MGLLNCIRCRAFLEFENRPGYRRSGYFFLGHAIKESTGLPWQLQKETRCREVLLIAFGARLYS